MHFTALAVQVAAQKKAEPKSIVNIEAGDRRLVDTENNFGLSQIGQIAISVNDIERATAFYPDKLGMKYLFTANGLAFFGGSGIRLMLARLNKMESDQIGAVIYFKVNDTQEGYKALLQRGVKFEEVPEVAAKTETFSLWRACFKDSESNSLCLMSEIPVK